MPNQDPIDQETFQPLWKEQYHSNAPVLSGTMIQCGGNDTAMYRMIMGRKATASGVIASQIPGHRHMGQGDGVYLNRHIGGVPQHGGAIWTAVSTSAAKKSFAESEPHHLYFDVPNGCNGVKLLLCASLDYASAGGADYVYFESGSQSVELGPLQGGGITFTRLWSGETNGPACHNDVIPVEPGSRVAAKLSFRGAADPPTHTTSTLIVYGWQVIEASTL